MRGFMTSLPPQVPPPPEGRPERPLRTIEGALAGAGLAFMLGFAGPLVVVGALAGAALGWRAGDKEPDADRR